MRHMTTEDLGDPRLYEDEAIREQAAALQVHVTNMGGKIELNKGMSMKTIMRLRRLNSEFKAVMKDAEHAYCHYTL